MYQYAISSAIVCISYNLLTLTFDRLTSKAYSVVAWC